jgi:hypothetical protein
MYIENYQRTIEDNKPRQIIGIARIGGVPRLRKTSLPILDIDIHGTVHPDGRFETCFSSDKQHGAQKLENT